MNTLPTYPGVSAGAAVLSNMGSFWHDHYDGNDLLKAFYGGYGVLAEQMDINLQEASDCLSRVTVPIFHRELYLPVSIIKSECNNANITPLRYGTTAVYGSQYNYGQAIKSVGYRFPLTDTTIAHAATIADSPINPTKVFVDGVDFIIDRVNGYIEFLVNPFTVGLTSDVIRNNGLDDEQLTLWAYQVDQDQHTAYRQFGYILGVYHPISSQQYKNLVNAYFDALVNGTAILSIRQAIAAVCDIPCIVTDGETVEQVIYSDAAVQVVTDQRVYTYSPTVTVTVAVGDALSRGDFPVDQVRFIYPSDPNADMTDLVSVTLGKDYSIVPLTDTLTFRNDEVDCTNVVEDGKQIVTFPVGGFNADVQAFWEMVRAQETATGTLLANAVTRSGVVNTVNPFMFVMNNLLGDSVTVITLDITSFGGSALGIDQLAMIRSILPAHSNLMFFTSRTADTETAVIGDVLGAYTPMPLQLQTYAETLDLPGNSLPANTPKSFMIEEAE